MSELIDLDALLTDLNDIEQQHLIDCVAISQIEQPEEVLKFVTVDQIMAGHNLRKGDNTLTSSVIKRPFEVVELERAARAKLRDKRKHQIARARKRRAAEAKIRDSKPLDPKRLESAWEVIGMIAQPITKLTVPLYNRFRRVLGDTDTMDIGQNVAIKCAESFARSDAEMDVLREAAEWLSEAPMPYEAADGPEGARQLIGTIVRIARTTIVDTYRSKTQSVIAVDAEGNVTRKDVTLQSFELLETVARQMGTDVDALIAHHHADNKPTYHSKSPMGLLSKQFTRVAVDAFIEARDMGWCADLMLSDEHTRTDGSFRWTEFAPAIFDGFGMPKGELTPGLLTYYAKRMVRLAFKDLPDTMLTIRTLANDPRFMWDVTAKALQIDHMGVAGVPLATIIMRGEKPDALSKLLTSMEQDLEDINDGKIRAMWKRRGDITLTTGLDNHFKLLNSGARIFLEGQEDGTPPTLIYHGPDNTEFKKILRQEPSKYACDHGQRVHLVGFSKKPKKWGRVWHGDFCKLKGEAACAPIFQAEKHQDTLRYYNDTSPEAAAAFA